MYTALAITHVAFEGLGSLGRTLKRADFNIEVIDACTQNLREIDSLAPDLLIVMGGPIGVYDHDDYPFIQAEIDLLRSRLVAKLPTLGICLGAQLIAAALGAKVYPGEHGKEIGWAPIHRVSDSMIPDWFMPLLNPDIRVLHWHGDTYDLPQEAVHLAGTPHYPNQAFTVGNYAVAFQFHPEVTVRGLENWYVGHAFELAHECIEIRQLREDSHCFGPLLETAAQHVWQQWLDHVFKPTRYTHGNMVKVIDPWISTDGFG